MPSHRQRRYPLLAPLSILYGIGSGVYHGLYNKGILKSYFSSIPTICVGNIAAGGTGKTPMVEALLEHFSPHYKVAVLSRGYKRKTRGMVVASPHSSASEIGDEPYQMRQKYPEAIFVVSTNRRKALHYLEALPEKDRPNLIILDDGFQHRAVSPFLSIVLTSFHHPYFEDKLLPWGRLREAPSSLCRSHCVVVTKCPADLSITERKLFARKLGPFKNRPTFFATIHYGEPYPLFPNYYNEASISNALHPYTARTALLAGCASNDLFFQKAHELCRQIVAEKSLSDHYSYSKRDVSSIDNLLQESQADVILTTEKDASKLIALEQEMSLAIRKSLFCLPIKVSFLDYKGSRFLPFIEKALRHFPLPCHHL